MSRLAEFRALEQQLAAQLAELESLKNDDGLKKEIEFEQKLRGLLGEYGYSLRNIIAILAPQASTRRPLQRLPRESPASHTKSKSTKTGTMAKSLKQKVVT